MREKSLSEIIEEARERASREIEFERELEAERNRDRGLGECYDIIKGWKKKYFAKKLKSTANIYARSRSVLIDGEWYRQYFIQVFRKGNFVEQYNVRPEAFDTLTRGLESTVYADRISSTETFTLHQFIPSK
jgi:hypothetical protein